MWYLFLIALLAFAMYASWKWIVSEITLKAYVGYMLEKRVCQPTDLEMEQQIKWVLKNTFKSKK